MSRLAATSIWHGESVPKVWCACPEYFARRGLEDTLLAAANAYEAA